MCGLAFTFPMLLGARVMQGVVDAPMIQLSQSLITGLGRLVLGVWGRRLRVLDAEETAFLRGPALVPTRQIRLKQVDAFPAGERRGALRTRDIARGLHLVITVHITRAVGPDLGDLDAHDQLRLDWQKG